MYDCTDINSFNSIHQWINEVNVYSPDNVAKLIICNKADLADNRVVSTQEGKDFADRFKTGYIEASAKDSTNVEEAFNLLISLLRKL